MNLETCITQQVSAFIIEGRPGVQSSSAMVAVAAFAITSVKREIVGSAGKQNLKSTSEIRITIKSTLVIYLSYQLPFPDNYRLQLSNQHTLQSQPANPQPFGSSSPIPKVAQGKRVVKDKHFPRGHAAPCLQLG
jgi:hypothetical protein